MNSERGTIARNSIYNLMGPLIPILIGLITIPQVIKHLGMDRFGLLSLLWVFLGYLTFVDMGLSRAVIKLVAEQLSGRRDDEVPQTIWTTIWISSAFSALGSLCLISLSGYLITHYFKIPDQLIEEGKQSLVVIALSLPIVVLNSVFRGVLEGQNRFFAVNVLQAINGTMTYLSPLLIAPFTTRIDLIILTISGARFILAIAHWVTCVKRVPGLSRPRLPTKTSSLDLLHFGSWLTVSNIISPIMVYFDRFFLGSIIPVGELAYYTTPYEIITRVLILPAAVARTLFPAFTSSLNTDPESAKDLLPTIMRLVSFVMAIVAVGFLAIARPGLYFWLGPNFADNSTVLLQVFTFGIFFNAIANMPHTFLQSAGRPDLTAKIHLIELPCYLLCLWLAASQFGSLGAAWTWTLRLILDCFLLIWFSEKITERKIFRELEFHKILLPIFVLWYFGSAPFSEIMGDSRTQINTLHLILMIFLGALTVFYYWAIYLRFDERARILGHKKITMVRKNTNDHFGAVIVTFNPRDDFDKNLESIAKQFERVCVVDNASANIATVRAATAKYENVLLIDNQANLGLGKALNQGVEHLATSGCTWVATFDQDSKPSEDYLSYFKQVIGKAAQPDQIGILAPTIFDTNLGKILRNSRDRLAQFLVPVSSVITSGSIINVNAFEAVGPFEESFFIDYIDHNFAFRIRQKGFLVAECPGVQLQHQLGDSRAHHFLFRKFYATHHSPLRRYYITRNRVQFYKEFFLIDPIWVLLDINYLLREVVKIVVAESMKRKKLKLIMLGFYDGVVGRMGPFTERGILR